MVWRIDAVEVIARLLRRDRELRLVDQPLQIGGRERRSDRQLAGGEIGEIASGSACSVKRERPERIAMLPVSPVCSSDTCGAVGQFADDVVEGVGRHGGRARLADLGRRSFR